MEARKIVIIETKNQKKSVIMSAATTLAELKADLSTAGIDYSDMTFYEGISKTELKTDGSILPHDLNYKGTVTNELVFMLTNTNKKIRSGACEMSRAEAYSAIKSMGLQDACVKKFGKNFTMCKTADLIALVKSNRNLEPAPTTSKAEIKKEEKVEVPVNTPETSASVAPTSNDSECVDNVARTAISKLVEILEDNGIIEDYDEVLDILGGEVAVTAASYKEYKSKLTSSYSNDEIDSMFADMNI